MRYSFSIIILVIIMQLNAKSQHRELDSLYYAQRIDSLFELSSGNKEFNDQNKLASLIALSYYKELENTRITFKYSSIQTTASARPTVASLIFRRKENRKYIIRLNNKFNKGLNISGAGFNARVGVIGHELAHILYYNESNFLQMMDFSLRYLNPKQRAVIEKNTDVVTISRGLGWQLYDWSYYILNRSDADEKYKLKKSKIYLTPDEIQCYINCLYPLN